MGFVSAGQARAHGSMMYEERLEAAERRRLDGNALYAAGSSSQAMGKYAMGLSHLNEDLLMQLEGVHLDKANAVRLPILLNMAACHLRLQDYNEAIACCTQACPPQPGACAKQLHLAPPVPRRAQLIPAQP